MVLSTTPIEEERRVQVLVPDNSIGQALKALQKKMQREGIFREMKLRGLYEKPSERRVREKVEAAPARKLARSARGLLPIKPWVIPGLPEKAARAHSSLLIFEHVQKAKPLRR